MPQFEYSVVTAPRKSRKVKGVRGADDRFARNMEDILNEKALDGWEYQRSESLPVDEKSGVLRSSSERYHNLLIFRREQQMTPADSEKADIVTSAEPQRVDDPHLLEIQVTDTSVREIPPLGGAERN